MSSRAKKKKTTTTTQAKSGGLHSGEKLPASLVAVLDQLRVDMQPHVHGVIVKGWVGGLRETLLSARRSFPPLPGDDALPEPSPELVAWVTADVANSIGDMATQMSEIAVNHVRRAVIEVSLTDGPMRRRAEGAMRRSEEPLPPALVAALQRARAHYESALDPRLVDTLIAAKERGVKQSRAELLDRKDRPDEESLERLAARMRRSVGYRKYLAWDQAQRAGEMGVGVPDGLRDAMIAARIELDLAEPLFIWANYATYVDIRKRYDDFWEIPAGMPDPFAAGAEAPTLDSILDAWKQRIRLRLSSLPTKPGRNPRTIENTAAGLIEAGLKNFEGWDPHQSVDFLQDDPPPGFVKFLRKRAQTLFPDEDATVPLFREIWIDTAMTVPPLRLGMECEWKELVDEVTDKVDAVARVMAARQRGQA